MATMADVARHAGVTKQTVSNVLNGKAVVRQETRQKVLAAIEELGYRPNLIARGLSMGKTSSLAVLVPTIANPFYSEVVEEVESILEEHQQNLILCTTHDDRQRAHRQLQILVDKQIDGILLAADRHIEQEIPYLVEIGMHIPIIICCWESKPYPDAFSAVDIDYHHAGQLAGQHLLDLGHRDRIAIVFESPAHQSRLEGFRSALLSRGIELSPALTIATAESTYRSGYQAAQQLFSGNIVPSAIFATTDWMALGVMDAARDAGLRIPKDLSLVGFDDVEQAAYTHPPLTTIAIPKREMAREMTEMLLRRIAQGTPQPRLVMLLRSQVMVRNSTAAPCSSSKCNRAYDV